MLAPSWTCGYQPRLFGRGRDAASSRMSPDADLAAQTRRRITLRLMPFLFLLYLVSYLDRVNVSYASLEMTRNLHFPNVVFGLGSGIFFLGYLVLEVPGAILVERWSARKWIARIMISWGLFAALTGFIHTTNEFYGARFLLGDRKSTRL